MEFIQIVAELKQLLSPYLGTIQSGNSPALPAIVVDTSKNPQGSSVTGLLCSIQRTQLGDSQPTTGGWTYMPPQLRLRFINYSNDSKLSQALQVLQASYTTSRLIYTPSSNSLREAAEIQLFLPYFLTLNT